MVCTWGRGEDGQLGHGNASQVLAPRAVHALIDKGTRFIACGAEYTVAVTQTAVYSWGWGDFGRLGHGDACDLFLPRAIDFFAGRRVERVACGDTHTLVVTADGALFAFGRNQNGQLGLGHCLDSLSPQPVQAMQGSKVASIACGAEHSVVATSEGKVYAWGWGRYGNLGDGQCEDRLLPTATKGLEDTQVVSVVCGWRHSVAVSSQGQILTWGWGKYGQLGHGSLADELVPRQVEAFNDSPVASVSGGWRHTCAADVHGTVYGWGWNKFGQLGLGDTADRCSPCSVSFPGEAVHIQQVASGWRHTIAVSADGRMFSWGRGVNGQLGTGREEDALRPVVLTSLCRGAVSRQSLVETTSAGAEMYVVPSDRYAVVPNGGDGAAAAAAGGGGFVGSGGESVGSGGESVVPLASGPLVGSGEEAGPPTKKPR